MPDLPAPRHDLTAFVSAVGGIIDGCRLDGVGRYRRYRHPGEGGSNDMSLNPYGCADAANLLYTLGRFPADAGERAAWVEAMRGMQDPKSGLFEEATHHTIHVTAHVVAALELFEARPLHPLTALHPQLDHDALRAFLNELDWGNPWPMSHRGAGLYAALVNAGEADPAWERAYFAWLWSEVDPESGMWRKGHTHTRVGPRQGRFPHLAGTFHYLFNLEHAHQPLRHPDRLIDTCLEIAAEEAWLTSSLSFAPVDWIFAVNRARRQTTHRSEEATEALRAFGDRFIGSVLAADAETSGPLNDLHTLFGVVCGLAELQAALPGEVHTPRPLRLVLDRRPFI